MKNVYKLFKIITNCKVENQKVNAEKKFTCLKFLWILKTFILYFLCLIFQSNPLFLCSLQIQFRIAGKNNKTKAEGNLSCPQPAKQGGEIFLKTAVNVYFQF